MLACDAHIHILPGMDNGPRQVAEAEQMVRTLYQMQTKCFIATPHFDMQKESCAHFLRRRKESFACLEKAAQDCLSQMKWILSAEVLLCPGIARMRDLEKLIIPGTRMVPFELPLNGYFGNTVAELRDIIHKRDINPLICSFERCFLMYPREEYEKMLEVRYFAFQVNAKSLTHPTIAYEVARLSNAGYTILLGSNAHNMQDRIPLDESTYHLITRYCGATTFRILSLKTKATFLRSWEH